MRHSAKLTLPAIGGSLLRQHEVNYILSYKGKQKNMSKKNKLRIIPLGGLGEVGKNMMAYEFAGDIIVVDAGIMFPENDMLGVDYIIPDFEYLTKRADRVRGLIITHGHEDHIGAIQHFIEKINVQIYA